MALVCRELLTAPLIDVPQVLNSMPEGLTPLYDRMISQIQQLKFGNPQRCLLTLATATLAYRPHHILEICLLAGLEEKTLGLEDLARIINMCGSFLKSKKIMSISYTNLRRTISL